MARKCSNCGDTGHNSRTCSNVHRAILSPSSALTSSGSSNGGLIRLFGVQLEYLSSNSMSLSSSATSQSSSSSSSSSSSCMDGNNNNMKKSFSLDSLSPSLISNSDTVSKISSGYLSDIGRLQDKRKGVPWTEEEHRAFLLGLERLGKGDWRGISSNFVTTRTPTQVASHAQKYFLRQACLDEKKNKKRQSSLFDLVRTSTKDTARNRKPDYSSFLNPNVPSTIFVGSIGLLKTSQWGTSNANAPAPDLELSLAAPSAEPLQGKNDSQAAAIICPFT